MNTSAAGVCGISLLGAGGFCYIACIVMPHCGNGRCLTAELSITQDIRTRNNRIITSAVRTCRIDAILYVRISGSMTCCGNDLTFNKYQITFRTNNQLGITVFGAGWINCRQGMLLMALKVFARFFWACYISTVNSTLRFLMTACSLNRAWTWDGQKSAGKKK